MTNQHPLTTLITNASTSATAAPGTTNGSGAHRSDLGAEQRRCLRSRLAAVAFATTALGLVAAAPADAGSGTNTVEYWCGPGGGMKFEPVTDPFLVPAPPAGMTWTTAVVKAGSGPEQNFVIPSVAQGDALSYPGDAPANSHVILCWDEVPAPAPAPVVEPAPTEPSPTDPAPTVPPSSDPAPTTTVPDDGVTEAASAPEPVVVESFTPAPAAPAPEVETVPMAVPTGSLPATGSSGVLTVVAAALVATGLVVRRLARRVV